MMTIQVSQLRGLKIQKASCKQGKRGGVYAELDSGGRRYYKDMQECETEVRGMGQALENDSATSPEGETSMQQTVENLKGVSSRMQKARSWLRNYMATPEGKKDIKQAGLQLAVAEIRGYKTMVRAFRRAISSPLLAYARFKQSARERAQERGEEVKGLSYLEKEAQKINQSTQLSPHELATGIGYTFSWTIGLAPGVSGYTHTAFTKQFTSYLMGAAGLATGGALGLTVSGLAIVGLAAPIMWKHCSRHVGRIAAEVITGQKIDRLTWETSEGYFGPHDFHGNLDKIPPRVQDLIEKHPPKGGKFDSEVTTALKALNVDPKLVAKVLSHGYSPDQFKRFSPDGAHEIWESHYVKSLHILSKAKPKLDDETMIDVLEKARIATLITSTIELAFNQPSDEEVQKLAEYAHQKESSTAEE